MLKTHTMRLINVLDMQFLKKLISILIKSIKDLIMALKCLKKAYPGKELHLLTINGQQWKVLIVKILIYTEEQNSRRRIFFTLITRVESILKIFNQL